MEEFEISSRKCYICTGNLRENRPAEFLLLQPADSNDLSVLESEAAAIAARVPCSFCLAAFLVEDWNRELTPWDAPAVFGHEDFGHGAQETLTFLEEQLLPALSDRPGMPVLNRSDPAHASSAVPLILGGYSLAGFFALWAGYQSGRFHSIAAASPSVWFPGWDDYVRSHSIRSESVYLSLGNREEKTRNRIMASVGGRIREQYDILKAQLGPDRCTLEWNEGNHFRDTGLRCAKAFAWCIRHC